MSKGKQPALEPTLPPSGAERGLAVSQTSETLAPHDTSKVDPGATIDLSGSRATIDSPGSLTPFSIKVTPQADEDQAGPEQSGAAAGRPQVHGYDIISELGRGGMGVVYKARQKKLHRLVALKMVLAGAHAGADQLARFYTEAEAVAHLQHPNIVQIYEVAEHEGLPYFALEYVDGGGLERRIDGKPQPVMEAARIVELLARAMSFAHENGIIHRDLKPANVLMTADGFPKITDFGLAKRLESDSSQTKSGTLMGTPSYMAPEQARGEVREVGPLADIYALGVILYELLTGRTPFIGSSILDTLQQVRSHEPVPPSRLQPKVPRDLETICLKCLQKEPPKRYATAAALADDLRRFQTGEPIQARPVSRVERIWRWCKRNPKIAALSAVAALLLLSLAVGGPVAAILVAQQKAIAERARDNAVEAQRLETEARRQEAAARKQADEKKQEALVARDEAEKARQLADENAHRAKENADRADKQRELAVGALNTLVTKVQTQLGDTARTYRLKKALLETAVDGLNKVSASSDARGEDADATRAEAHLQMGAIFTQLGQASSARNEYAAGTELYRRLVAADPANGLHKWNLSRALSRLATANLLVGDSKAAELQAREALDLRLEEYRARPNSNLARLVAQSHIQMADVLRDVVRTDDANAEYQAALAIQRELVSKAAAKDRPGLERTIRATYEKLGELHLIWKAEPRQAQDYYEHALSIAQATVDAAEASKTDRQNLAGILARLGMVSRRMNDREAAARYFEKSLLLWQQLAAEEDPEVMLAQQELGMALGRAGQYAAAAKQAEYLERLSPDFARNLYNVGCCYALCAGAVADMVAGGNLNAEQQTQRSQYLGKALEILRRAVKLGYEDRDFMRLDPDLEALRDQPEFQELVGASAAQQPVKAGR